VRKLAFAVHSSLLLTDASSVTILLCAMDKVSVHSESVSFDTESQDEVQDESATNRETNFL
jgi:hypothetical protein